MNRDDVSRFALATGKWFAIVVFFLLIFDQLAFDYGFSLHFIMEILNEHFYPEDERKIYMWIWLPIYAFVIIGHICTLIGAIVSKKPWRLNKVLLVGSIPVSFLLPLLIIIPLRMSGHIFHMGLLLFLVNSAIFILITFTVGHPILVWMILKDERKEIKRFRVGSLFRTYLFTVILQILISFSFLNEIDLDYYYFPFFISFILGIFILGYLVDLTTDDSAINRDSNENENCNRSEQLIFSLPKAGVVSVPLGFGLLVLTGSLILSWDYDFPVSGIIIPFFPSLLLGLWTITMTLPLLVMKRYHVASSVRENKKTTFLERWVRQRKIKIGRILEDDSYLSHNIRGISVFLGLLALGSMELVLDMSELAMGHYHPSLEIFLYLGGLLIFTLLIPRSIVGLFRKEISIKTRIADILVKVGLIVLILVILLGIIGPYERSGSWYSYIYLEHLDQLWFITALIPNLCLISLISLIKPKKKQLIILSSWVIISTLIILIWNRSLVGSLESGDSNIITRYSSVFFTLIPAIYGILVPIIYIRRTGEEIEWNFKRIIKSIQGTLKRSFLSIGPLISILAVFVMVIAMVDSYDAWHDYDYNENLPVGQEGELINEYLSQDIPALMNETLYAHGHLLDPNFISSKTIMDMRSWIMEKEKGDAWGDYYAYISGSVTYNESVYINRTIDHNQFEMSGETDLTIGDQEIQVRQDRHGNPYAMMYIHHNNTNYIMNSTGYHGEWDNSSISVSFHGIAIIKTSASIGEQTAPLCGYGSHIKQYIGIEDERIVFIYSHRDSWVS